jgi:hypothetical protein
MSTQILITNLPSMFRNKIVFDDLTTTIVIVFPLYHYCCFTWSIYSKVSIRATAHCDSEKGN